MANAFLANIPRPSKEEVDFWLHKWDELPDYTEQEAAINELFCSQYSANGKLRNVLIKCSVLNDFYSTNIYKVYPVAVHILSLDIDERLKNGDITLVNDIAQVTFSEGKSRFFYSFASKYCSHHNPEIYPIYDYYVDKMLRHFRQVDKFYSFVNDDLKNYPTFKKILKEFQHFYGLENYTLKDIDKYLWQVGKEYYPRKY